MPTGTLRRYVIGIGSNIAPDVNVPAVLRELARQFGRVRVSAIVYTRPVDMQTERDFYNLAVLVETDMDAVALKAVCNRIEIGRGRDRNDPERAHKDRPADLDILFELGADAAMQAAALDEPYYRETVIDLLVSTGDIDARGAPLAFPSVDVTLGSDALGKTPATVHWEAGAGDVRVVH